MANSTLTEGQVFQELAGLVKTVLSGENVAEEVLDRYVKDFSGKPGFQQPAGARIDGNEVQVLNAQGDILAKFQVSSDGKGSWEQCGQASAAPSAQAQAKAPAAATAKTS